MAANAAHTRRLTPPMARVAPMPYVGVFFFFIGTHPIKFESLKLRMNKIQIQKKIKMRLVSTNER